MFFSVFAGNTAIFKRKGHTENKVCLVKWFKIRSEHDFLHNIFFKKKESLFYESAGERKIQSLWPPGLFFLQDPWIIIL